MASLVRSPGKGLCLPYFSGWVLAWKGGRVVAVSQVTVSRNIHLDGRKPLSWLEFSHGGSFYLPAWALYRGSPCRRDSAFLIDHH